MSETSGSAHGPGGVTAAGAVAVRIAQAADEPRVLQLLRRVFGEWPRLLGSVDAGEFYRWKHEQCPFGRSLCFVAEADNELVGFIGFLPWRLRTGAQMLDSIRGLDLAVARDHRRRGVSMSLIEAGRAHYPDGLALGWSNPNALSRGGALKGAARRRVDGLPRYLRPGPRPGRTLVRALGRGGRAPAGEPALVGERAADVLADTPLVTRLLERAQPPRDRLATARDPEFLEWRYGRFEVYWAVLADSSRGLAIFRVRRHGRYSVAQVCDLLVDPEDLAGTRRLLGQVGRAAKADVVACTFPSRAEALRCGFVRSPQAAMITANPLRAGIVPDPALPASWALSLGDLELL